MSFLNRTCQTHPWTIVSCSPAVIWNKLPINVSNPWTRYIQHCTAALPYLERKEGNILFNDALNTFYLGLYGVRHMLKDHSETRCRHMGYSFRLAVRVLLYASSHRQDNTYDGLCYTSRGALGGTRNSSIGT